MTRKLISMNLYNYASPIPCQLLVITNQTFLGLKSLTYLSLRGNKLSNLNEELAALTEVIHTYILMLYNLYIRWSYSFKGNTSLNFPPSFPIFCLYSSFLHYWQWQVLGGWCNDLLAVDHQFSWKHKTKHLVSHFFGDRQTTN